MTPRPSRLLVVAALLTIVLGTVQLALASHAVVSLPGSDFEIDSDANLKVDDAGAKDWKNVSETRKDDVRSGRNDNSLVQGTKEDTAVPTVETGSIPPNKSDLKTFGVYKEINDNGRFLHMFWSRVQDPSGSTNMDFEFNHNACTDTDKSGCSTNGVTPIRAVGDLLVTYDLTKGGTSPVLSIRSWNGSAWGAPQDLTSSGDATGSINSSSIPAGDSDGLGSQDPRTFGEATIDLDVIFRSSQCESFGGAYLKSRSSFEFNSALKDFIAPMGVTLSNCGSVKIIKTDDAGNALDGAEFTLYKDVAPVGTARGAGDVATTQKCTTAGGTCTISDVLAGNYWIVETVTPANHDTAADIAISVAADERVERTIVNPRHQGAILVTKTRKHAADGAGDHPHAGVYFTVSGGGTTRTAITDADGNACFGELDFGTYSVSETVPAGYQGEAAKSVTVDNKASCLDATFAGESVSFANMPLSNVTMSFESQVPGGTAAKIDCDGVSDSTPDAFDDTSETMRDLVPGTYSCTVIVDP